MGFLLHGWMAAALCLLVCLPGLGRCGWQEVVAVLFALGGPLLIDLHSLRTEIFVGVVA